MKVFYFFMYIFIYEYTVGGIQTSVIFNCLFFFFYDVTVLYLGTIASNGFAQWVAAKPKCPVKEGRACYKM